MSRLTGAALDAELHRLALRAALDAHYTPRTGDRPDAQGTSPHFLAVPRGLDVAGDDRLEDVLRAIHDAMADRASARVDAETLPAATAAHLAVTVTAA